jgi:hypothetical protein
VSRSTEKVDGSGLRLTKRPSVSPQDTPMMAKTIIPINRTMRSALMKTTTPSYPVVKDQKMGIKVAG